MFCGGAVFLSDKLAEIGANEIVPRGECDAVSGEATTFHRWTTSLVGKMASDPLASTLVLRLNEQLKNSEEASSLKRLKILKSVTVQVFSSNEVKHVAGDNFLKRGSMNLSRSDNKIEDRRALIKHSIRLSMEKVHSSEGIFTGTIVSRKDIIVEKSLDANNKSAERKTSLIKIDIIDCGSPPYEPGDHVRGENSNFEKNWKNAIALFFAHLNSLPCP